MAVRTGSVVAYMTGEGQSSIDTQPAYGDLKLEAKKMTAEGTISYESLQDSSVDLINEMTQEVGEQFALLEGQQFVNGSGGANNMPGFMQHADIGFNNSGDANKITFDSLIRITGDVKTGYQPIYAYNRKTLAELRLLKDSSGRYIWESGNLGVDVPSNINGVSYVILPDMPDIAAGTFPVIFGDFKNFMIGERKALTVVRDELTLASQGLVKYVFHRRVGAVVTKPEAFKKIKISA
jgi:HK97 family phage major capsid protein